VAGFGGLPFDSFRTDQMPTEGVGNIRKSRLLPCTLEIVVCCNYSLLTGGAKVL